MRTAPPDIATAGKWRLAHDGWLRLSNGGVLPAVGVVAPAELAPPHS